VTTADRGSALCGVGLDGTSVGYGFGWTTNIFHHLNERYREREQLLALGGADLRHAAHGGRCVAYNHYMIRLLDTQRTIIVLTNHLGVPGPRVGARQVAEISSGIEKRDWGRIE
jgi:hypothetical protein